MTARLVSLTDWNAVRPVNADKVSVQHLRLMANSGFDGWGRKREQPVSISVILSLRQPFATAALADQVNESTVHYGNLSKLVAANVNRPDQAWRGPNDMIQALALTAMEAAPQLSLLAAIEVDLCFLKASLNGDGICMHLKNSQESDVTSITLQLCNIRMPALVGVNSHERNMKQAIVVNVWVDRVQTHLSEHSFELEPIVVKTVEESSFETLESLAEEIAHRVIKFFVFAYYATDPSLEPAGVRVKIEKPAAVPLADAPAVELFRSSDIQGAFGKRLWNELGSKRPQIPYPLPGRLDEYLQSWKQD